MQYLCKSRQRRFEKTANAQPMGQGQNSACISGCELMSITMVFESSASPDSNKLKLNVKKGKN